MCAIYLCAICYSIIFLVICFIQLVFDEVVLSNKEYIYICYNVIYMLLMQTSRIYYYEEKLNLFKSVKFKRKTINYE